MSELDNDFEKVAEEINTKIKEAAEALKKANELASKAGLEGLIFTQFTKGDIRDRNKWSDNPLSKEELESKIDEIENQYGKIDVTPLEVQMGSAGWSTSSSYC